MLFSTLKYKYCLKKTSGKQKMHEQKNMLTAICSSRIEDQFFCLTISFWFSRSDDWIPAR